MGLSEGCLLDDDTKETNFMNTMRPCNNRNRIAGITLRGSIQNIPWNLPARFQRLLRIPSVLFNGLREYRLYFSMIVLILSGITSRSVISAAQLLDDSAAYAIKVTYMRHGQRTPFRYYNTDSSLQFICAITAMAITGITLNNLAGMESEGVHVNIKET